MKIKILIPSVLGAAIAWSASGQAVAPAPPAAPAGSAQVNAQTSQSVQQNNTAVSGSAGVNVQGDPNPGGLHKREEFPNVVIPGELRRNLPGTPGDQPGNSTNDVATTNQFATPFSANSNQFKFNSNKFNFTPTGRTNDAGAASPRPTAFRDRAATREDQVLLIKLRQSISTELQAAATTTAPGGNTITPPVHFIVDNGAVRIVGIVPAPATRERILMIVQRIPGVVQVVDELQVSATGTTGVNATTPNP